MARPLRIEFPGALYYLSSRGNGGYPIFKDSEDGSMLLEALSSVCKRFGWECLCYCFMSDSYHLVVETPEPNLSKGMRQLNGVYTQNYNRRHGVGGHVFQGRYKSILIQKEKYLVPLVKQVFRFPLKAGFVKHPNQFKWSSCKYLYGKEEAPKWINSDWFRDSFTSIKDFEELLFDEKDEDILNQTRKQIYLGDDDFIADVQSHLNEDQKSEEVPRKQLARPLSKTYSEILKDCEDENMAIARTYLTGNYTLKDIGDYLDIHYSGVSKIVSEYEKKTENQ